jgi:hypothetical protein
VEEGTGMDPAESDRALTVRIQLLPLEGC